MRSPTAGSSMAVRSGNDQYVGFPYVKHNHIWKSFNERSAEMAASLRTFVIPEALRRWHRFFDCRHYFVVELVAQSVAALLIPLDASRSSASASGEKT
ncbi:MAG: hypothetical protein IT424_14080 [Pirellulales bacterium]|nr:hypothetical protein [Pirellulales bacterium]